MKTKRKPVIPAMNWSAEDVHAGMIVCRRHVLASAWKPDGWTAKWTHMIGFVPGDATNVFNHATHRMNPSNQYCQIAMTDGMVYHRAQTKEQMAADLTKEDMIPMPRAWWLKTVLFLMSQTCPNL